MRGRKIGKAEVISGVALLVGGASLFKLNCALKSESEILHETRMYNREYRSKIQSKFGTMSGPYVKQWRTDLVAEESAVAAAIKRNRNKYYFDPNGNSSYKAVVEEAYLRQYKADLAVEAEKLARLERYQIEVECMKSHGKGDSCTRKM